MMRDLTQDEKNQLEKLTDIQVNKPKYAWDDTFQKKLLGMLLTDQFMLIQAIDKIKSEYFINEAHSHICTILLDYFNKQKTIPEKWIIEQELKDKLKERDPAIQLHFLAELHAVYDYYVPGLETREYLIDKVTYFAKVQAVKGAFNLSLEKMKDAPEKEETWNYVYEQMRQAMLIDRNYEPGLEYFMNLDEMFKRMDETFEGKNRFTTAFTPIDDALTGGGLFTGQIGAWIALPGRGKCNLSKTPVLTYDGIIKIVDDIKVGDLLMGNDSTPRKVLNVQKFIDRIYEVKPVKGDSYFVNSQHILSLKNSHRTPNKVYKNSHPSKMGNTNIFNISIENWFKQSNHFKIKMKGWRTGVEFPKKEVKIDPYILGVWLGHKNNSGFTNVDENVSAVYSEAKSRNRWELSKNILTNDLQYYNLINNKYIPVDYKTNSREIRLQVLAGLLDTNGHMTNGGFEITQKIEKLADDIVYLARSLGLAAYKSKKSYYRVIISGDCSVIPVRINYKKAPPRKQIKDVLLTGVNVIDTGKIGVFYSIETDGNHLFLLGDFTVVHNSLALTKASVANVLLGHKVLYLTMELNEVEVAQRFTAQFAKLNINNLRNVKDEVFKTVEDFKKGFDDPNLLHVKQFPGGVIDVNGIRAYVAQLELRKWKPNLIVVDYVGEMKDDPSVQKWESAYRTIRDLRSFGVERDHCTITCVQPNASASKLEIGQYIDESNIGTSFDQFKPLDAFWSINQQVIEKDAEVGRVYVIKHRNGRSGFPFKIGFDYKLGTLDLFPISKERYREAMSLVQEVKMEDIEIDGVVKKKQKNKKSFQGDTSENTYEA